MYEYTHVKNLRWLSKFLLNSDCNKMDNINFHGDFFKNFDELLLETDNPLINSQEHYTDYKQEYLKISYDNFNQYENLISEYKKFNNIYDTISPTKIIYTYVDEDKKTQLYKEMTQLIISQRKLYNNFMNYINHLNTNFKRILPNESKSNSRQSIDSRRSSRKSTKSAKSVKSLDLRRSVDSMSIRSVQTEYTSNKKKNIFAKLFRT